MTLEEALNSIHSVKGNSTILGAIIHSDYGPIQSQSAIDISLKDAEHNYHIALEKRDNCNSDWAYWGYQGDVSYWSAVVDILKAAELVGENNLPDIKKPDLEGKCCMDAQYYIELFGKKILKAATKKHGSQHSTL